MNHTERKVHVFDALGVMEKEQSKQTGSYSEWHFTEAQLSIVRQQDGNANSLKGRERKKNNHVCYDSRKWSPSLEEIQSKVGRR